MSTAHGEQIRVLEEHGQQSGRSMEWWGMSFFVASEALVFANFIAAFLYLKIRSGESWHIEWQLPLLFTAILIASSATMHVAGDGIRKGDQKKLVWGLAGTILLGAIFLGGQGYEYYNLVTHENFTISSDIFGSAFYTLTGFHGLHVTIGVIFLVICLIRGTQGHFTAKKHFAVEAAEMYWHFVDIVWIVVFSVIYLMPLLAAK